MKIKKLENPEAFEKTKADGVCMIDFIAPWCGPCMVQKPIIEELACDFDGLATIAEIDVSANRELAEEFGIYSIPTLVLFSDGKEMERFVGLQRRETLKKALYWIL